MAVDSGDNLVAPQPCTLPVAHKPVAEPEISKLFVTYEDVHKAVKQSLPKLAAAGWATPDYLIAISGGGLIPARILRGVLRSASKQGGCATIKVIGLELYDDEHDGREREVGVVRTQWLDLQTTQLAGKRILVVDEVDDSRQTLEYAVRELRKDIAAQEAAVAAAGEAALPPAQLGVFVLHNKERPKKGVLPAGVPEFVAHELGCNPWIYYPWDAECIEEHNMAAGVSCENLVPQSSGSSGADLQSAGSC